MKIAATIEARITSRRLPGKVLMPAAGKPMLEHLVNRLKAVPSLDQIVLATTTNHDDDIHEKFASDNNISCYRGSEFDLMSRVIEAAGSIDASVVVDITGDCPIIDPQIIEQRIRVFRANKADYVNNAHVSSYPAGMTDNELDHEHVTLHIRNHPEIFSHIHLPAPPESHWPFLGLTLDYQKDYELLKKIIEYFEPINPLFCCRDVINLLKEKTEWILINQNVARNR